VSHLSTWISSEPYEAVSVAVPPGRRRSEIATTIGRSVELTVALVVSIVLVCPVDEPFLPRLMIGCTRSQLEQGLVERT
jgi:hypothetical protein